VAVILNRLATDFFVLMPLGRRIILNSLSKKSAQYRCGVTVKQGIFWSNTGAHNLREVSGTVVILMGSSNVRLRLDST
jgi:hypothetical protein